MGEIYKTEDAGGGEAEEEGEIPGARAAPFLKLFRQIRAEMEEPEGNHFGDGSVGAGFRAIKYIEDYRAYKDRNRTVVPMDQDNAGWWAAGGDKQDDNETLVKGKAWVNADQYFFELVSEHEYSGGSDTTDIGTGHRRWLRPGTIYDSLSNSNTADVREGLTKKIEFLMQILQMIKIVHNQGVDASTSRGIRLSGDSAPKGFLNNRMPTGDPHDEFNATATWCFTSGDREGLWEAETEYHAGYQTIFDQGTPGDFVSHHSAWNDSDFGAGGHLPTAEHAGLLSIGPGIRDEIDPLTRNDSLTHYIRLSGGHSKTRDLSNADYRYESWGISVTFEGFLFYLAQLVNYLDIGYGDGYGGSPNRIHRDKPIFQRGRRAVLFPNNYRDATIDPYWLPENQGYNFTLDELKLMKDVIDAPETLIPNWLRTFWRELLHWLPEGYGDPVGYTGAPYDPTDDPDRPDIEFVDPPVTGYDPEPAYGVPPPPGIPGFSPSGGASLDPTAADFDPEASPKEEECLPPEPLPVEEPCATCTPNPDAFVFNWTTLKVNDIFLNKKDCDYSVVIRSPYELMPLLGDELDVYIEQGAQLLLDRYKKASVVKVLYADGTSLEANSIDILMGRVDGPLYLGSAAADVKIAYKKDRHVPAKPLARERILVAIPAALFDLIPTDMSDMKGALTPEVSTYVNFKSKDVKRMIRQVSRAFRVFSRRYARYVHNSNYEERLVEWAFGDLDLMKESENLKYFREDLQIILKHHGYNYILLENIKIGFEENDGSEDWKPYKIDYIEINEPGCAVLLCDKPTWEDLIRDAAWNNRRTLGYIAKLPDIHMDVTAAIFPEWNEIAAKYTYGVPAADALMENLPEDALDCFMNDLLGDPLDQILNNIANGVLGMPAAIANKFNKLLCSGEEFDRMDPKDILDWKDVRGMWKRATAQALEDAMTGDPVFELLYDYFYTYKGAADGFDARDLWRYVLDKYGWCGIVALIDMLLGCLLKGIPQADGLAILVRMFLKALPPMQLEKVFIGLPADKQQEIAAAVAEATGQVLAFPPWELDYKPGSYSYGPENEERSLKKKALKKGEALVDEGTSIADMSPSEAADYAAYQSTLKEGDDGYVDPDTIMDGLKEHHPLKFGEGSIYGTASSYAGVGTIGAAADSVADVVVEAYVDAILDIVEPDMLLGLFESIPGASQFSSLVAGISSMVACKIPPMYSPPFDDFLKTLELDFCRGNFAITLPHFNWWPIKFPDIWAMLRQAIMEAIRNLILQVIFMLMKFILDLLMQGLCKLMGLLGTALQAALTDNFRETFRNALCGDPSNPTSQITDAQLDQAVAGMLNTLAGCPPPSPEAASNLIADLTVILDDVQLMELLNGEISEEALRMIQDVIDYRHPEFKCALDSTAKISDLFGHLGSIVPPEYKKLPTPGQRAPIVPAFCRDQDTLDEFYDNQCKLLQNKGLSEEECNEIIDGMQDRAKEDIETLANIAQNGLLDNLLPDLFADDPNCPGTWNAGLIPRNDPATMSAAAQVSEALFENLEGLHQRDMLFGHGVLNMVLAAQDGQNFKRHFHKLMTKPETQENRFPESVAGYLKNKMENLQSDITFSTDPTTADRELQWGADAPPTFMVIEKKLKARCYPSNTDFDEEFLDKHDVYPIFSFPTRGSYKNPDLTLEYEDWKEDQPYSFKLEYGNFEMDGFYGDETPHAKLDDSYKILIKNTAKLGDDVPEDVEAEDGSDEVVWYEGFSGAGKDEIEIRELIDAASEDYGNLDIDDWLTSSTPAPKNLLYGKLILGSWEEPLAWMDSKRSAITGRLFSDVERTPVEYSDSKESEIIENYYSKYDNIFQSLLVRMASFMSDSEAYVHGVSQKIKGPPPTDKKGNSLKIKFKGADGEDSEVANLDEYTPEEIANEFGIPFKVALSGSYTDPEGGSWDIPPEVYGGTEKWPAFYMQTPKYKGWAGIKQTLTPEEIYTGCDEPAESVIDLANLNKIVDDLYQRLPDDSRLQDSKTCMMEHPWNKVLDRYSSSGLEASIRATIRIYIVEALIKGMPVFTNFEMTSPENFDELYLDFIIDSIDDGLREQTHGRKFKDPYLYYLTFMEQIVQCFGNRIKLGDFEPTTTEQAAIDRLTGASKKPNPLNQHYWEKHDYISISRDAWPSQVSSGIMAAVGSTLGPAGAIAGAIAGGAGSVLAAKKRKKAIWKRYISHPDNLRDTMVLMRRFVSEEMDYIGKRFSKQYREHTGALSPGIKSANDMFLTSPMFMIGALGAGGPVEVGYWNSLVDFTTTVATGDEFMNVKGLPDMHYINLGIGELKSPPSDDEDDEPGFYDADSPSYWPFVLERYVKITNKLDLLVKDAAPDEGLTLETDPGLAEALGLPPAPSVKSADKIKIDRDKEPQLQGIVNIDEWKTWVRENSDLFEGKTIEDVFGKIEVGIRICHISETADTGVLDPGSSATSTVRSPFVPSATRGDPTAVLAADAASRPKAGPGHLKAVYTAEVLTGGSPTAPVAPPVSDQTVGEISMKTKSFRMWNRETGSSHFVIPLVSAEVEISPDADVIETSTNLGTILDEELDCLVADLVAKPRYKLLFEYCFSLPRAISILTIYNSKALFPSMGTVEFDEWDKKIFGQDGDLGGGKMQGLFQKEFRTWDWHDLFKRSKRQAKNLFEDFYNATDLNYVKDKKSDNKRMRTGLQIDLKFNINGLGSLMKRRRRAPFNKQGQPCPLIFGEED